MKSIIDQLFSETSGAIVEIEDMLRTQPMSNQYRRAISKELVQLYELLERLWPSGRGKVSE